MSRVRAEFLITNPTANQFGPHTLSCMFTRLNLSLLNVVWVAIESPTG